MCLFKGTPKNILGQLKTNGFLEDGVSRSRYTVAGTGQSVSQFHHSGFGSKGLRGGVLTNVHLDL